MADRQHIHGRLTTGKWQTSGREAAQKWLESSSQAAKKGRQWQGRAIATNVCNSAVSQAMGAADQYKVLNERSALPQKQAPEGPCRINSGGNQWSWLVSSRNGTIKTQSHPNPWEASAPSSGHVHRPSRSSVDQGWFVQIKPVGTRRADTRLLTHLLCVFACMWQVRTSPLLVLTVLRTTP
eukprot:1142049-Pelagomonas_calceolata.AAC.8